MKKLCNKSVLLIDDDAGMLCALDKVLTGEGAAVSSTIWAGEALEILTQKEKQVNLVITDLRMPFMNGMMVLSTIHKGFPALPVIVLTAFGSPDVKAECLRQGAADFLEKPLNTLQLLRAVEGVFASQKARS